MARRVLFEGPMRKVLFLLTCSILSTSALAEPQRGGRRRPPREALEACANKEPGDECEFEGRGTVRGVCFRPEANLPLACRPARKGSS